MKRVGVLLTTAALVAGMIGCGPAPSPVFQYDLTIASTEGGNVTTPGEGTFTYDGGRVINLVAVADEGHRFVNWTGHVGTIADVNSPSTTIIVNADRFITACFAKEIWDWYDLDGVRGNLGGSYLLMSNLDSTSVGYEELAGPTANGGSGWESIGTTEPFSPLVGSVDGQGYEIRDLFIDRPDEDSVGLFGIIDEGGVVENIGVVGVNVTGGIGVGGLTGNSWGGTIMDCYSSGSVVGTEFVGGLIGMNDDGAVVNCWSAGNVAGDLYTGGLVGGHWSGLVSNSYSNGTVTGQDGVGGLVGENHEGAVDGSYATGGVSGAVFVGGLVGYNDGTVLRSYAAAGVSGDEYVGGLAGWTGWQGTVSNSFWDTQASGIEESAGGTGKTTEEMQAVATFTDIETEGLDEPWDMVAVAVGETDEGYVWNIVDGLTHPFLSWQSLS